MKSNFLLILYEIIILFILCFVLFICQDYTIFFISVVIGSFIFLYNFSKLFHSLSYFKLSNLLNISYLGLYVVSTLIVLFLNSEYELTNISLFGINYSINSLCIALGSIYLVSIFLKTISIFERATYLEFTINDMFINNTKLLLIIILIIILTGIFTNVLVMNSTLNLDYSEPEANIIGGFGILLASILLPLSLFASRSLIFKNILLILFLAFSFLIVLMVLGRRAIVVESFIGLILYKNIINKNFIFNFVKIFYVSLIFILISIFVLVIRNSDSSIVNSPLSTINGALASMSSRDLYDGTLVNIRERPFALSYVAELITVTSDRSPLLGQELDFALNSSTPKFFNPDKSYLPLNSESFIHPQLGIPIFDGPNSLITSGYNDFGYLGIFIYVSLFLLCSIIILSVAKFLGNYVYFVTLLPILYLTLFSENDLGAYLVAFRNLLFFMILYIPFIKISNLIYLKK